MTHGTKYARRRPVMPAAAMAGLLLAGCSSGHIGESWQCPLAAGGSCDSVAAADPAVPDADAARTAVLRDPLWRVRDSEPTAPAEAPAEKACAADCARGFDPFGWLMRLFGADPGSVSGASEEEEGGPVEAKSPPGEAAASLSAPAAGNEGAAGGTGADRPSRPAGPHR